MLGFVVIVALIASTAAYIPEYTEDVIQKFSSAHPELGVITAEVYNADNGMKFRADDFYNDLELKNIWFSFYFDEDNKPPMVLDVPVYKVPSEFASADETQLQKWAASNNVGVFAPVKDLLRNRGEWKSDFKWLDDLVSYGIFRKEATHLTTELYTTHPLVMSDAEIESIFEVVGDNWKNDV